MRTHITTMGTNHVFQNVFLSPLAMEFLTKENYETTIGFIHLDLYYFECRQCGSRYVGRTLQHLSERIKQHVPLSILSQAARSSRPKRGRPRKHPTPLSVPAEASAPQTVSRKNQHSTQKSGTNINVNKDEHCVLSSLDTLRARSDWRE